MGVLAVAGCCYSTDRGSASLLPGGTHRAVPYLYSAADITALLAQAERLKTPLRRATITGHKVPRMPVRRSDVTGRYQASPDIPCGRRHAGVKIGFGLPADAGVCLGL